MKTRQFQSSMQAETKVKSPSCTDTVQCGLFICWSRCLGESYNLYGPMGGQHDSTIRQVQYIHPCPLLNSATP